MKKREFRRVSLFSRLVSRFLVFVVLILVCLIFLKGNSKLRGSVYELIFENNLKFAKVNEIYEKYFGSALPLEGSDAILPVSSLKIQYDSLKKYKDGVILSVSQNYAISCLESGIVIFTGEKEGYGNTVIIQGADETEFWYANLNGLKVQMYDYIKKGEIVGEALDGKLVLAFKKDGKVLDYKKFI